MPPFGDVILMVAGGASAYLAGWVNATGKALVSVLQGKVSVSLPALARPGFDRGQELKMDDFREDFRTIVYSVGKEKPLVVLIDDLDRCPFEQVIPLLESIKHFGFDDMDEANLQSRVAPIAFVLAADRQAIERAVAGNYKSYRDQMPSAKKAEDFAREYVEKIVQIPFDLPPLTRQRLEELLKEK